MNINPNVRIFATGKTQSGKSYWVRWFLGNVKNFFVYDVKQKDFNDLGARVGSLAEVERALSAGCTRLVYQPSDLSVEHFDAVMQFVYSRLKNMLVVVDEVQNFCAKMSIPEWFNRLIVQTEGEPKNIGILAATQRPQAVHNNFLGNCTLMIVFRLPLPADAKAIQDITGIPSEEIMNLRHREFIVWDSRLEKDNWKKMQPL